MCITSNSAFDTILEIVVAGGENWYCPSLPKMQNPIFFGVDPIPKEIVRKEEKIGLMKENTFVFLVATNEVFFWEMVFSFESRCTR